MEPKEKSLNNENNGGTGVTPQDKSLSMESNGGKPAKNEVKTKRSRPKRKKGLKPAEWVAFIGALAPIVIAIINSQAIIDRLFTPDTTPTFTSTPTSSPAPTDTPIPVTETSSPTVAPSSTSTITITITPSETITLTPAPALIVRLENDKSAGRPPLTVNFDARDSYLIASDGQQYPCKYGACNYTWKVVLDGQQLEKSQPNSSGKFQYTFGKRGRYLISVWICRGKDAVNCGGNGIFIEVG